jgi:hypothetical protein
MIDPLISTLLQRRQPLTKDQFNRWRRDPVTEELFNDLQIALLERFSDDLPLTADEAMPLVFAREGAKAMLYELDGWLPEAVRKEIAAEGDENEKA